MSPSPTAAVTTPVFVSIAIPGIVGTNPYTRFPVPLMAVNVSELNFVPYVVVIGDPPVKIKAELTVMVSNLMPIAPSESVAVTVSRYIPGVNPDVARTIPVTESMVMPGNIGRSENTFVPVPKEATNGELLNGIVTVVTMSLPAVTETSGFTVILRATLVTAPTESVAVTLS